MPKRLHYICFIVFTVTMGLTLLNLSYRTIATTPTPLPRAISSPPPSPIPTEDDEHASFLDAHSQISEDEILEEIRQELPNIPWVYLDPSSKLPRGFNRSCGKFPELVDLEFDDLYWQIATTSNGTFRLIGAYMDARDSKEGVSVKLLGVMDRMEPTVVTHCLLWFKGAKEPVIVKTSRYFYIWYAAWGNAKQGINQPYLLTCKLPPAVEKEVPLSVSLVEKPCDKPKNNLRIFHEKPKHKKDFAVCVKGLDFLHEDVSIRLAEWIELIHLLGAEKIYFYQFHVHPNITRLLDYYTKQGKVEVVPLTLPGTIPNSPALRHLFLKKQAVHRRQLEVIPYNDCFYRHMYEYRYIVLLDTDEVIFPVKGNWHDLIKVLEQQNLTNNDFYYARNVYFLDNLLPENFYFRNVPRYLHMSQHVYRTQNYTKPQHYVKGFHNTQSVSALHNHFPMTCIRGGCATSSINTDLAHLQHYREDCVRELKKTCDELKKSRVMDSRVWRFSKDLVPNVEKVLKYLGYLT